MVLPAASLNGGDDFVVDLGVTGEAIVHGLGDSGPEFDFGGRVGGDEDDLMIFGLG